MPARFFVVALVLAVVFWLAPAQATEAGWALVREGGQIVLLNHARTSGGPEPSDFAIGDCATQRGLTEQGRTQARRIGALFAARAAPFDAVLTSQTCRASDTARLVFEYETVEPFPALDPLSADATAAEAQTAAVLARIKGFSGAGNLALVTDAANIEALTGVSPRESEAVIVRPEGQGLHVLARIVFN